jgi:AsmA-like protein
VSGEYTFEHADLNVYHGIGGILSSQGKFGGVLKHIDISGSTDIPDFEVRSGHHQVHLATQFSAYVDGTDGDTYLKRVDAHFLRTQVVAEGSIAKIPGRTGKTALIDLVVKQGRIEDVLGLFVKSPRAPMSGPVGLKAKVEIPPGKERFLEKVKLQGTFGVDEGTFTKPDTQTNVNKLSAGARGQNKDDPETVLTDLRGQVRLDHGISTFTELSFGVPGASARLHGTYNIIDHRIDLHGQMQVDSQISKTTTGMKALLLKVMDPIFKKRHRGEVVPVHIGGTYEHPQYGLDLSKDKKDGQQAKSNPNQKSKSDASGTSPKR